MKNIYILFILLFSINATAQIPANYYDYATGTGYALKTQLNKIINNVDDPEISNTIEQLHIDRGYNALDGFNATYERDFYYDAGQSNKILDIYSENPTGPDPYTFTPITNECGNYSGEGDCYNKEHIIPQSVFGSQTPMYSDAHHLLPTDGRVNGFRSNYPFGKVNDAQLVSQNGITNPTLNGSKLGNNLDSGYSAGYTGIVFEPIDEFKGDVARIYFYFATRYENQISAWSAYAMFDGSSDKVFDNTFLSILLTWHQNDPVSQKEIDRNNNIYYNLDQRNRNPFVDHPEYVAMIWNITPDTTPPSNPTNLVASNPTDTTINLNWTASTDNIGVTSYDVYMDATYLANSATNSFTVTGLLPDTLYCFDVKAKDAAGNESGFSNQACETTTNNGSAGNSTELFFSEYMEGGSNNKALEIANFTSASVNLSIYTIKASFNGSGTWGSPYSFPGGASISSSDVYVVANSSLAVCTGVVDNSTNNSVLTFNGNDAIGLFKNDLLIDMIGVLGSSSNFAQNVTLVRKPEITTPVITYNANEWNSLAQDTCSDLGSHNQTLSIDNFNSDNFKIYPNPVKNSLYINLKTPNVTSIEIYSILGKKVLVKVINDSSEINTEQLSSGVYIMKITQNNTTISKKLIKN